MPMVVIEEIMKSISSKPVRTAEDIVNQEKLIIYGILATYYQQNPHEDRSILDQAFVEIFLNGRICYKFVASKTFINLI